MPPPPRADILPSHNFQENGVTWLHNKHGPKVQLGCCVCCSTELDFGQDLDHGAFHLQQSKTISNALARTHTKRHVRVGSLALPVLGGEPIGVKFLGVWP